MYGSLNGLNNQKLSKVTKGKKQIKDTINKRKNGNHKRLKQVVPKIKEKEKPNKYIFESMNQNLKKKLNS